MSPLAIRLFKIGCWIAILTAAMHMAGTVAGPQPPANDTERTLIDLATHYKMTMPGGQQRSLMQFMDGFSLSFSLFMAFIGATGLIVAKRGLGDPLLMLAMARAHAITAIALVVIAIAYWFIIPAACVGAMAICFTGAALVRG